MAVYFDRTVVTAKLTTIEGRSLNRKVRISERCRAEREVSDLVTNSLVHSNPIVSQIQSSNFLYETSW